MSNSDAECIPTVHLKDYLYYGNVSTYIREKSLTTTASSLVIKSTASLSGQCEVWKNVLSAMTHWAENNSIIKYWTYPDESMNHSNCRNFDLTLKNDENDRHLAIHMKIIKSNAPAIGPWCYAYDTTQSKYHVARCFPACVRNKYQGGEVSKHRTKISKPKDTKPNYNRKLIDTIAARAFSRYEWGPSAYYDSRPSSVLVSAEFEKNRYSIFFALIAIGMTVMICSISFIVIRNYCKFKVDDVIVKQEVGGKVLAEKIPESVALTPTEPSNTSKNLKQEMETPV